MMKTPVNWTREKIFRLISLWSEDVQQQLEDCRRNSLFYRIIADDLGKAGYTRSLEQCKDKIKKLKGNIRKSMIKERRQVKGGIPNENFLMH